MRASNIDTESIEKKRLETGISVTFLCKKLGITTQAYYRRLKSKTGFTAQDVFIICDVLKIPLSEAPNIFYLKVA